MCWGSSARGGLDGPSGLRPVHHHRRRQRAGAGPQRIQRHYQRSQQQHHLRYCVPSQPNLVRQRRGFGNNVPATLTISNAANDTFGGIITNGTVQFAAALSITKANVGDLLLSGSNNYTGTTSINGGTLTVANAKALAPASPITFGGGRCNTPAAGPPTTGVHPEQCRRHQHRHQRATIDFANALGISNSGGLTKIGAGKLTLNGRTPMPASRRSIRARWRSPVRCFPPAPSVWATRPR